MNYENKLNFLGTKLFNISKEYRVSFDRIFDLAAKIIIKNPQFSQEEVVKELQTQLE